jgi:four helix bundle protein
MPFISNLNTIIYQKTTMHNYKNLKIWHEAMDLATEIYSLTKLFPEQERYSLTNQIQRAAISIPSNIAEGTSRSSQKEFKHYLTISMGSAFEVTTQVELSFRLGYINEQERNRILNSNELLQRKIQAFSKQLNNG